MNLSPNPIGVITILLKKGLIATLLKKGLTENFSNNMVGVINRRNGCGTSLFKKGLTENISNDEINIVDDCGSMVEVLCLLVKFRVKHCNLIIIDVFFKNCKQTQSILSLERYSETVYVKIVKIF
ncbi:hypothetical protein [Methanosarcina barkeri]|uniref:hypothetical protein n=1 Tax=Methanosarcina barkeri TaxID=2208 RepID=UPI00003C699A|nr:hypothetical protein [Methanosarcina barkeri]